MRKLPLILVCVFLFSGCSRTPEENALVNDMTQDAPSQEAFNVTFIFSEQAILQAKLIAPHLVEIQESPEKVMNHFDRGLHLEFYNPDGSKKSDLTAEDGKFREKFGIAEVTGNVEVVNEKKEKLNTERLFWDSQKNRIYSNDFVKIQTEQEIIYGDSMEANTDFSEYKIFNIRGTVSLKEENP